MKKFFHIVLFIIFNIAFLNAQELLWQRTHYINSDSIYRKEWYNNATWWNNEDIIVNGNSILYGYFIDIYSLEGQLKRTINGVAPNIQGHGGVHRSKKDNLFYYGQVNNATGTSFLIQEITKEGDTLPRTTYIAADGNNLALALVEDTTNQSYIISGWSSTRMSASFLSVLRVDYDFNKLWSNAYPKVGLDTVVYNQSIVINHKGNYVTAGSFSITSKKYEHPYLVEIKPNGDTVQTKIIIIKDAKLKEDGYKRGLTATADKGYLFLATIDTFMTNKNVPDQIGAVVKLDSNFNIQWVQYIILGTNSIEPTDIVEMEDGSFTVSIIESKRWSDYFTKTWIYKISKKGTLLSKWNIPLQICIYTNGFYMFFLNDSTAIISGNCGEREGYIARIGGLGNPMHPSPRPAPYITLPEPVYTIPNLITPNNDRANDTFEILSNQIPATGVQLKIYNRWGSQVYTSANYQHNWAAEDLPDGVYFYQAEVKDKKYKGWVQVMR